MIFRAYFRRKIFGLSTQSQLKGFVRQFCWRKLGKALIEGGFLQSLRLEFFTAAGGGGVYRMGSGLQHESAMTTAMRETTETTEPITQPAPLSLPAAETVPTRDYTQLDKAALISRIQDLERALIAVTKRTTAITTTAATKPEPTKKDEKKSKLKVSRTFDASQYPTQLIAIKFAYLGATYNGYEFHINNVTPLPTIEEVLFCALLKARLVPALPGVEPQDSIAAWPGDDAVSYSKCGRTDRGVSAFGQVVNVRVRSTGNPDQEFPYANILNRLLPLTIRVLAVCTTVPESFSARFSCRARHYRYFFTTPAVAGVSLDVSAMAKAASMFLGTHDFRNFCKLDASKQITNFERTIFRATIEPVDGDEGVWYFELQGTAFLWHQVRHMMAVLFLVGQGLEPPEVIRDLLDLEKFPTKPMYEMADDRPLVLWNCVFPEEVDGVRLAWIPAGCGARRGIDRDGLTDSVFSQWHEKRIGNVLARGLMEIVEKLPPPPSPSVNQRVHGNPAQQKQAKKTLSSHPLVLGTGDLQLRGAYIKMQDRRRMRSVGEINRSWVERKGDWAGRKERREKRRRKEVDDLEFEIDMDRMLKDDLSGSE